MWLGELLQPLLWFPEKKKAKRLSLAFWRSVVGWRLLKDALKHS